MDLKRAYLSMGMFLILTFGAYAQEALNASDLTSKIISAMDLSFSQGDKIKPIVQEYVTRMNQIESQGEANEKSLRPQIKQLDQEFDQGLGQVFTPDQLNTWNMAKKQILPSVGGEAKEGREANEANEANEPRGK